MIIDAERGITDTQSREVSVPSSPFSIPQTKTPLLSNLFQKHLPASADATDGQDLLLQGARCTDGAPSPVTAPVPSSAASLTAKQPPWSPGGTVEQEPYRVSPQIHREACTPSVMGFGDGALGGN